jgi:iron complex outermembrane recepter protein
VKPNCPFLRHALAAAAVLLLAAPGARAQTTLSADPAATETIVVTGSLRERRVVDAPYAITAIDGEALRRAGPMINLSEALGQVPGLTVNNRNNYAQDLQISARGFGARAGFGVRGLRLYTDGVPATMPDGQGQVAHFDLAGAERVEVLRGPFSVLYGNSSGGVIALFSRPVTARGAEVAADVGGDGLRQFRLGLQSPLGDGWEAAASASTMSFDGFRPQSAADRQLVNLRLAHRGENDRFTLLFNHHQQDADDPLGLDRALFDEDPYQTVELATQYDTRKTVDQTQLGVNWRHLFAGDGVLREFAATAYTGRRAVTQFLAISPFVQQSNASHGGGVVDFDRRYSGLDARTRFAFGSVDLAVGATVETQADDRRGFENFIADPNGGDPTLGVRGTQRRDERNTARTQEAYAQAEWTVSPALAATLALRGGTVKLGSDDAFLANGDDSGQRDLSFTNPVLGVRYTAAPGLTLHASVARGFESPTLNELAYRSDGSGGFNTALDPQTSRQFETGLKWRSGGLAVDATAFLVDTDNEIGVQTNAGGRQSFQNVGSTRRVGLELGTRWQISPAWRAQLAANWLDATYRDTFLVCDGVPCFAPSVAVPAGNRIAGTSRGGLSAELAWRLDDAAEVAAEARANSNVAVNDRNSDFAAGYGIVNLRYTRRMPTAWGELSMLVRVDNLFDRAYAGSVIVNEANGRFFETAAPRTLMLGVSLKPTW